MIVVSHDRLSHLGVEAVVFLDTESGECWQIQRDLPGAVTGAAPTYHLTTGVGAPVPGGIIEWRRVGNRFEFALNARSARMFGGSDVLSFEVEADSGTTVEEIGDHVARLLR